MKIAARNPSHGSSPVSFHSVSTAGADEATRSGKKTSGEMCFEVVEASMGVSTTGAEELYGGFNGNALR